MKKLITLLFILVACLKLSAQTSDNLDSLKKKLQVTSDSLKGPVYLDIATQYINQYDTLVNRRVKARYQNEAINYTMLALHFSSRYDDTLGMRTCFNNLAKVYRVQKKYSQAKWFNLQSASISRDRKDSVNLIASLVELSGIKAEIKDYNLAMRDLNEALSISIKTRDPRNESVVQLGYVGLYKHMKDIAKANSAMKRHDFLDDSIRKDEAARMAKLNTPPDTTPRAVKKGRGPLAKKKVYTANSRRPYKLGPARQLAFLQPL